ncbi:hypothetical protein ACJX0J_036849, partial [Zea mays]
YNCQTDQQPHPQPFLLMQTIIRAIIAAMMKVRGAALAPAHVSMSRPSNDAGVIVVDVAGAVAIQGDKDSNNNLNKRLMGAPIQGILLVAIAIAQETGNVYSQEDKAQLAFNHYSNLLGTSPAPGPDGFIGVPTLFLKLDIAKAFDSLGLMING